MRVRSKPQSAFETGFRIDGLPPGYSQSVDAVHSEPPDDDYRLAADPEPEQISSDALPLGAWLPEAAQSDPMPPPRADRNDIDASIQAVRAKRQESAAKSRHVMLVATFGSVHVLVAIGMFVAFLRWINQPKVVAQNKPPLAINKPAVEPTTQPNEQTPDATGAQPDDASALPATELPLANNSNLMHPATGRLPIQPIQQAMNPAKLGRAMWPCLAKRPQPTTNSYGTGS